MNNKLSVSLFSDSNFLSVAVLENLLSKNCYVNILTSDLKEWKTNTTHLLGNNHFSILDRNKSSNIQASYSLLILGFDEENPYDELREILVKSPTTNSKTLILLPFEKYSYEESSRFNFSGNLGVVYLGDLLGPRMNLTNNLLMTQTISDIYFRRKMNVAIGELFYPTFVGDAAKTVGRWLFSFGPYGRETFLFGSSVSATDFWKENSALVGEINLTYDEESRARIVPKGVEVKQINSNLRPTLIDTYKWLAEKPPKKSYFNKSKTKARPKKKRVYPKFLKPTVLTALSILLLPIALLIVVSGLFFLSYKQYLAGNDEAAQNAMLVAKTLGVISKEESRGLQFIPLLGRIYKEIYFIGDVGERASDIAVSAMPVVRSSSGMLDKILGNTIYDPTNDSLVVKDGMDSLYLEISLLQADSEEAVGKGTLSADFLTKKIDLNKLKNLALQMKSISEKLPSLMGKDGAKTYLVLFQNNTELRPTGGFIGSFGLLTFDGGRISDFTISDVYSADGQLNGHVEPPLPIKKYLGEANWWLRDSNWDPDFPTSAKRAEWFLDKETGRSVDGVMSVDLQPIKDILKFTGPIFLPDFNMQITTDNLYEKTQAEVQENFFPGTHKKASFLTALSRSLLSDISKLGTDQKVGMLKSFYSDLESRSFQIFLHEDSSQNAISSMGWDGGVNVPDCGTNCYADMIGTVEANVGVNKANYFVQRNQSVQVSLTPSGIERKLVLSLKNTASPALGATGTYKTYLRLLSDTTSDVGSVRLVTGQTSQLLPMDVTKLNGRTETGVYIEVLGGQTKSIEFTWKTNLANSNIYNMYGLYLRKQAGVAAYPVSLTVGGVSVYNGLLAGDTFSRINW